MARIEVSNPCKNAIEFSKTAVGEAMEHYEKEFLDSFKTLDNIGDSEQKWIIDRVIPQSAITVLNYSDSISKVRLMNHIISALSSGRKCLFDSESFTGRDPLRIAYLSEDMETFVVKDVLTGCGANTENIIVFNEARPEVKRRMKIGYPFFERFLAYFKPDLVVLDNVEDFFADDCGSESYNMEMLHSIAERSGTAFLIVSYKDDELSVYNRNRAIENAARSVLSVGYSGKDSVWYARHDKSNYGVPVDTILYRATSEGVEIVGFKRRRDRGCLNETE